VCGGGGWAEVHLYRDNTDRSYRLVGWTVENLTVLLNSNVTASARYKVKYNDFHKFVDEDNNAFGFGFYNNDESVKHSAM